MSLYIISTMPVYGTRPVEWRAVQHLSVGLAGRTSDSRSAVVGLPVICYEPCGRRSAHFGGKVPIVSKTDSGAVQLTHWGR